MSTTVQGHPLQRLVERRELEARADRTSSPARSGSGGVLMKILCVCRGGNVRSVAAKIMLRRYFGHEVLAAGIDNNSQDTLAMLTEWADRVVILHEEFAPRVPAQPPKLISLHVGEDVWGNPFAGTLHEVLFGLIMANETLRNGKSPSAEAVFRKLAAYKAKVETRAAGRAAVQGSVDETGEAKSGAGSQNVRMSEGADKR